MRRAIEPAAEDAEAAPDTAPPPPADAAGGEGGRQPDAALTSGPGGTGGLGGAGGNGGSSPRDAARDRPPPDAPPPADVAPPPPPDAPPPVDVAPPAPDAAERADARPPADGPDLGPGLIGHWTFDEGMGTKVADSSGRGNDGTLAGGATFVPGAPFPGSGSALALDGTNGLVTMRANLAPQLGVTATVTFWIRTTQKGNDVAHQAPGLTGIEQTDGSNDVFWGYLDADGGIGVAAGNAAGAKSDPIGDDMWHHVALTRDSGNGRVQVFIDGKLIRNGTTVAGAKTTGFTTVGRITNAGVLRAQVDDLRIYNRILPTAEVALLAAR